MKIDYSNSLDDFNIRHKKEDEIHRYHDELRHNMILKEILPIRKNDKIIELGCGSGDLFLKILKHKEHISSYIIGIDISGPNIDILNKKLADISNFAIVYVDGNKMHWNENVKVEIGDVRKLENIKSNTFDKVICSEVLEHIRDIGKALDEIKRITKIGGKIIITVPNLWHPFNWIPNGKFKTSRLERQWMVRDLIEGYAYRPYTTSDGTVFDYHYYYSPLYFKKHIEKYFMVEKIYSTLKWSNRPIYGKFPKLQEWIAKSWLGKANFWPLKYFGIQLVLVCKKK
jgi:ubiquinone/menaquinone biosynthesis C-methylase UbiE